MIFNMSSTLLVGTCMHLKLNIFMLFNRWFVTSKNTHHLASSLERGRISNSRDFWCRLCINLNDQTSTTTYIFLLGSTPISWCCWKQNLVSLLSCEFEYQSLANCCEVVWIHRLLYELGLDMNVPTTIMCDNHSAIKLSKNLVFHDKTKHFEIYWHFI